MTKKEHIKIQEKWQKAWEDNKIFESIPDKRPKFFLNFPYPYINAYQHIGHLFTLMRVEAFARYKRLRGFNVLFPQGWHATGSPIVQAAKRVKEREPKQLKIMKDMGFSDLELVKFEDPEYWIDFFAPEYKKDYQIMGMSVDWRREFHTTSLNPRYDKFIKWQLNKLKEKNYVIKGRFPVVWDPKEKVPVGDHDRVEGEGETPQEFILIRHILDDGRIVVSATLRQDTIYGITNLYVHPDIEYAQTKIKTPSGKIEVWIISEHSANKLEEQGWDIKITGKVKGIDLIGQKTKEFGGHKVLILPATFIDEKFGTGLVHSVPSDSADDLIALWDLQKDDKTIEKYNLNKEEIKAIKPISVLDTPGYGDIAAQVMLKKHNITSQQQRKALDEIKKELYKLSFYSATYNQKYAKGFSENLAGKKVEEGKNIIKKDLLEQGWAEIYYQLTGKVVSRSLTECVVNIVDNQWFIDYDNPEWKKLAHKCLDKMNLYPEKSRAQFDYVIDWLHQWACTRESGLGTRLPWDDKWLIESLSDSTIYMAYYTITHILNEVPEENINDELFDYIFLGKNTKIEVDKDKANEMKKEFDYWYPVDFRNSGKDLIQNHLTFYIFNHTAIFPEDKWPTGIGTNGWVTVNGQKMSKSLGNMIPVREMAKTFGADASRFTILSGGEGLDDPNWDSELAKSIVPKLEQLTSFAKENYGKGRSDFIAIDGWMESKLNESIKDATTAMEQTLFRTAIQKIFFEIQRNLKWYLRRCNNVANKELMKKIIESQLIMLSPFVPHVCEETWELIGNKKFISLEKWPKVDEKKIKEIDTEQNIRSIIEDVNAVVKLAKVDKPKTIKLFVAADWKYDLYDILKEKLKTTRNPSEIIGAVMGTDLKKHGQDIMKIIPRIIKVGSVPDFTNNKNEHSLINEAKDFLKEEFKSNIIIEFEQDSKEQKAKSAMPSKPAIIVE